MGVRILTLVIIPSGFTNWESESWKKTQFFNYRAAKAVRITYKNAQKPILSIKEALELTPEKVKTSKKTFKSGNIQGKGSYIKGESQNLRLCYTACWGRIWIKTQRNYIFKNFKNITFQIFKNVFFSDFLLFIQILPQHAV